MSSSDSGIAFFAAVVVSAILTTIVMLLHEADKHQR